MFPVWILLTLLPIMGGAERFNCKGRILGGYYADAKSGCKAFHVCVRVAGGGIRDFRFYCPPGTLFHQEAQTCTDWGDDDPLACPADLYDGQFDLYKIGSGYDTKKLSSTGNREDEPEFGLQRADTGDRRLSQNNVANGQGNDLRAAHSSDFFSGQRDRGRDEIPPSVPRAPPSAPTTQQRQSFRRATTPRTAPTTSTTQYTTPPSPPPPQPSNSPQYFPHDVSSKRKLVRKRPIYVSTAAPQTTFVQNTPSQQSYSEQPQQNFNRKFSLQNKQNPSTPDVPPQYKEYKDEYVEVSRVTPKQNKYYPGNTTPGPFAQSTPAPQLFKKEGLVELYNYDAQSTPGLNIQNDNRPFKVRNSFSVSDASREPDFARIRTKNNFNGGRGTPAAPVDYTTSRGTEATTPAYKNYNGVSYEPEKNNFIPYSKQNYFNNPTTTPSTTTTVIYTTVRPDPTLNLNTVAYNTNIGFHSQSDFAESPEDDGQYRPPQGEDDGQYRPELYDRELLSGAHSLNIAASGNRLPEDQKQYGKTRAPLKFASQTAVPRPFRPAPSPTTPPTQTSRVSEPTYTTVVPQTVNTQRTFDYFQTYTTTSRPSDFPVPVPDFVAINNAPARVTTTPAPRRQETQPQRPQSRATAPPTSPTTPAPRPSSIRRPHVANPVRNGDDTSYDYAYYDSDTGFSEYDHIEEFGRTKKRASI